jgi:NAD(P)-dependent dehydrogenase (short-subunit alcohol dehydrogenase family)
MGRLDDKTALISRTARGTGRAGVLAVTKHPVVACGPHNIRLNALPPGLINTQGIGRDIDGGGLR